MHQNLIFHQSVPLSVRRLLSHPSFSVFPNKFPSLFKRSNKAYLYAFLFIITFIFSVLKTLTWRRIILLHGQKAPVKNLFRFKYFCEVFLIPHFIFVALVELTYNSLLSCWKTQIKQIQGWTCQKKNKKRKLDFFSKQNRNWSICLL